MREVPAGETGKIRIVTGGGAEPGGAEPDEAAAEAAAEAARLLGLAALVPGEVESFVVADLGGLGLSGYLHEGYDVDPAALAADAAALDALEGRVSLVSPAAFGGKAARLAPLPGVRVLGPYTEARAAGAVAETPGREEPVVLVPAPLPAPGGAPLRVPLALLALVGLPVLALLIWWLS